VQTQVSFCRILYCFSKHKLIDSTLTNTEEDIATVKENGCSCFSIRFKFVYVLFFACMATCHVCHIVYPLLVRNSPMGR